MVSIIVPIYNEQHLLHKCLTSITEQTYPNIEVILIDDGSTDKSNDICKHFLQKDNRIKFLKQNNKGPASARNKGILQASGEYIQFVDADDYIEHTMTEELLKSIDNSDLNICGYRRKDNVISPPLKGNLPKDKFIDLFGELYYKVIIQSLCNKLYKNKIIKQNALSFNEHYSFGEDLRFNLNYIEFCSSVNFIQHPLYIYGDNKYSLTNSYIEGLFNKYIGIHREVLNFLKINNGLNKENIQYVNKTFTNSLLHSMENIVGKNNRAPMKAKLKQLEIMIEDKIVREHLPNFTHNVQLRVLRPLIKRNLTKIIYLFILSKELTRRNTPKLFRLLKKLNTGKELL